MQQVGVEAVVKGLSSFLGDIGKMNSSMKSLDASGNIISRTLSGLGNVFKGLGSSMLRVAEVALGVLVRDAFRAIVSGLGEIITSTIEAGAQFQIMQLRLARLNFNDLINSGANYKEAMRGAIEVTREQLKWLQKLAVTTPFDAEDIANVFTLAKSYGFSSDAAQGLTEDISNFAAGMGLGNTEIERIIVNFGQMVQQGKVTQREMNDLARGAFVPVNDILKKMQENVGLTDKEFEKFRQTGEGVQAFMEAFSQVVDERFNGAAREMARTFKGATDNAKDFVKSLIGFGVVRPVLDAIGGSIADVIDSLTEPERWDALTAAATNVGTQLSSVVTGVLGLLPSTENLADNIVLGLEGVGDWIANNKQNIIDFFKNIGDTIQNDVIPFIRDELIPRFKEFGDGVKDVIANTIVPFIENKLVPAFQEISDWAQENGPTIEEFFSSLGEIVGGVVKELTGMDIGGGGGLESFLGGVTSFMQYVIDNKAFITAFVADLVKLWGVLQIVGFVLSLILPPFIALFGFIAGIIGVIVGAIAVFQVLGAVIAFLASPIGIVIAIIVLLVAIIMALIATFILLRDHWTEISANLVEMWQYFVDSVTEKINELWATITEKFTQIKDSVIENMAELSESAIVKMQEFVEGIKEKLLALKADFRRIILEIKDNVLNAGWGKMGREIITGIARGVAKAADQLVNAAVAAATAAIEAVKDALGIHSPSTVFMGFGENMMEGMAVGISKMTKLATGTMQAAMGEITLPAIMANAQVAGSVSTQNNYTSNYNLTVNSSSPSEPIIQDYNMLKSLAGA